MAVLAAQQITRDGMTPTFDAADAAGDEFPFAGNTFVVFRNASGGAITVTAVTPGTVESLGIEDLTITVPAGVDVFVNGLSSRNFQNANRRVGVTYSAAAGLSVAVLAL